MKRMVTGQIFFLSGPSAKKISTILDTFSTNTIFIIGAGKKTPDIELWKTKTTNVSIAS